jgi:hypothetical protein
MYLVPGSKYLSINAFFLLPEREKVPSNFQSKIKKMVMSDFSLRNLSHSVLGFSREKEPIEYIYIYMRVREREDWIILSAHWRVREPGSFSVQEAGSLRTRNYQ